MTILVTGAAGWLGRHIVPRLEKAGHKVIGLDVVPGEHVSHQASVADKTAIDSLFEQHRFSGVIHGGALHKPDIARQTSQAFVDINIGGTLNLLEASVRHRVDSFVFTSTTSLMISQAIRDNVGDRAVWLDENSGPLEPRNIYGVTKLAAENLCRMVALRDRLPCVVLRTSRFFPETDDTIGDMGGANLKAVELLYRRGTVGDMVRAHELALQRAPELGFETFIVSAPTPFQKRDAVELMQNAPCTIERYYPDVREIFGEVGWSLPVSIGRVYDSSKARQILSFEAEWDFARFLQAMREGTALPKLDEPNYEAPHANTEF